jgi:hypothetical protein
VIDTAVCTNAKCPRGARREPTEWYPGAGQFCPDCGEPLRRDDVRRAPQLAKRFRSRTPVAIVGAVIIFLAVAVGAWGMQRAGNLGVRVCTSSMSDRLANEIVDAYSARHNIWPFHYAVTQPGDIACDVRFRTALTGPDASVIARDGVVAVVNPGNTLARLTLPQLRGVLSGQIVDWSQLGGAPGPIAVIVPNDDSDETQVISLNVMRGRQFGTNVVREAANDIARSVASPSGSRSIGIATFSAAVPAKVLALGNAPPPSMLSIANGRYPLSVRIFAESDFRKPVGPATALITFARSADTRDLVVRTAMVNKNGL